VKRLEESYKEMLKKKRNKTKKYK